MNIFYIFLITLEYLCIFFVIFLSKACYGADYRYEACVPKGCGNGLNISFPFYIPGQQESYCGYPGFGLNCSKNGFPVLRLPQNDYVVDDIFYQNRSVRVYSAAVSSSNGTTTCLPRVKNTTLPVSQFSYFNVMKLHLFFNCTNPLPYYFLRYNFSCDSHPDKNDWALALYDTDQNLMNVQEKCPGNVVIPVERRPRDDRKSGMGNLEEILRRGFVLNWTASDCSDCQSSGGRCGFNFTTYHFRCFCPDRPHSRSCKPDADKKRPTMVLAAAISGGSVFVVLCLFTCFVIYNRKKRNIGDFLRSRNKSFGPSAKSDGEGLSFNFGIAIFSYTELVEATNNFDSSKELGDGGYGTVYYGKLRDGREVAVKRLYEHNYRRVEQFRNEIKILTCLRHPNLVSLYGCTSRRSRELLLVYEYVPNGTVADHLHGESAKKAILTWDIRMNIAIETASALAYLHKSDIIHRDVKTNNILLDKSFYVRVADFGLSRLFPNDVTHISTAPQGTPGYVDPEYHQCYQLTDKSDVYSFGVVLIELISSMPAVDITRHRHEINLANFAVNKIQKCAFDELIDSSLGYGTDTEVTRMTTSVAELGFQCLQLEKEFRPSMYEILEVLIGIKNGEEYKLEKIEVANGNSKSITPSPETDIAVLLKKKHFQSSPNAVTDIWISGSPSTTGSIG